jgi:tetratricopeptide (TPR) repeat protein
MYARTMHNLALLYAFQNKWEEAEKQYDSLRKVRAEMGSKKEIAYINVICEFAMVYYNQAKYAQAEPLLEEALDLKKQVYPPQHPEINYTKTDLIEVYQKQGKTMEANELKK